MNWLKMLTSHTDVELSDATHLCPTQYLEREPCFSYLVRLLKQANLWESLNTLGTSTFFAPTNTALRALNDTWQDVFTHSSQQTELARFLSSYIIFKERSITSIGDSAKLAKNQSLSFPALSGDILHAEAYGRALRIYGYNGFVLELGKRDIRTKSIMFHQIDRFVTSKVETDHID